MVKYAPDSNEHASVYTPQGFVSNTNLMLRVFTILVHIR